MPLVPEMQRILALARREEASDIHIVAGLPPMFRVNREIILSNAPVLEREDTARLCYSLLNDEQKKTFERDWQLCCSVFYPQLGRFRVSIYYHVGHPEMAIRPVMDHVKTREELRLPPQLEDPARLPSGLVLLTGPTGSGKTTTLNYRIDLINSERRCLIIATCHTPSTVQTVERIVSIFPENKQSQVFMQLASSLQGILAHRLVPAVARKEQKLATELLLMNAATRKHIRDRELHFLTTVIQTGGRQGMHTMDDSLLELYQAGEITYDTAISNSFDPNGLRDRIHRETLPREG